EDPKPASCGARGWNFCNGLGWTDPSLRADELGRSTREDLVQSASAVGRIPVVVPLDDAGIRVSGYDPDAYAEVLPRGGDDRTFGADSDRESLGASLGSHNRGCLLHHPVGGLGMDFSFVSGRSETGASVHARDPYGSAEFSCVIARTCSDG